MIKCYRNKKENLSALPYSFLLLNTFYGLERKGLIIWLQVAI